jgi:hypothetical protein
MCVLRKKTAPVFQPTQTLASLHKTPSFFVKKERKNKKEAKKIYEHWKIGSVMETHLKRMVVNVSFVFIYMADRKIK